MEIKGVRFIRPATPNSLQQDQNKIKVIWTNEDTKTQLHEHFDTLLFAIGRDPCTVGLGLEKVGVQLKEGKVVTDKFEQSSIPSIFAIGDVAVDRPELTPVAIQAGVLLARRLYDKSKVTMDYNLIPTTVFTPAEYGCVGLSEEQAIKLLGQDNVETYLSRFGYLEHVASHPAYDSKVRSYAFHSADDDEEKSISQPCMAKLVCDKRHQDRVVGFHYVGPNAGEITQGFTLAVRLGATKKDFDSMTGIHPTIAEEYTLLKISGSSKNNFKKNDGC